MFTDSIKPNQLIVHTQLSYHLSASAVIDQQPLMPLLVYPEKSGFKLIDGFKRYAYLIQKDVPQVPVMVLEANTPVDAFLKGVFLNHSTAALTIVEQLLVVKILARIYNLSYPEMARRVQPILQLPLRKKFSPLYDTFFNLERKGFYPFLFHLKPSFKQIQQLLVYPEKNLYQLPDLFSVLPFKIKDALFFLDQLFRIEKAGELTDGFAFILTMLEKPPFPNLTPDKKTGRLKTELQKITVPGIAGKITQLQALSGKLSEAGLRVQFDKNLEKNGIILSFQVENIQQFENIKTVLSSQKTKKTLTDVIHILTEG